MTTPTASAVGVGPGAVAANVLTVATTDWTSDAAAKFWTPARLASATPADPVPTGKTLAPVKTVTPSRTSADSLHPSLAPASSGIPNAGHFAGVSTTGVIFYVGRDYTSHYCTATVVKSRHANLILTAAHCQPGRWAAFVPKYQHGARQQPYGVWAITKTFRDRRWNGSTGTDYDYEFVQVAPNSRGQAIQGVTGGDTLTRTPSYTNRVTVIGYPKITADSRDTAIRCSPRSYTHKLAGYRQMVFYCGGYYGGTSGSPWLLNSGSTGQVIGLIGGYEGGGPNDWISYSPIFDSRIFSLFAYAQSH